MKGYIWYLWFIQRCRLKWAGKFILAGLSKTLPDRKQSKLVWACLIQNMPTNSFQAELGKATPAFHNPQHSTAHWQSYFCVYCLNIFVTQAPDHVTWDMSAAAFAILFNCVTEYRRTTCGWPNTLRKRAECFRYFILDLNNRLRLPWQKTWQDYFFFFKCLGTFWQDLKLCRGKLHTLLKRSLHMGKLSLLWCFSFSACCISHITT